MANKRSEVLKKTSKMMDVMLNRAAEYMKEEFAFLYASVIVAFYEDYSPRTYERTFSTFTAGLEGRYSDPNSYTANPQPRVAVRSIDVGQGREIKMHISSEYIGSPYRAAADWVFDRTYVEGIHGFSRSDIGWLGDNGSFSPVGHTPKRMKADRLPKHRMDTAIIRLKKGMTDGFTQKKEVWTSTGKRSPKAKTYSQPTPPKYRNIKDMMNAALKDAVSTIR